MIYFKNKNTNATIQVGDDTPRYLAQCLVNPDLVEITEEEYDALNPIIETVEVKPTYEQLVQEKIVKKYSLADEIAIIRQIDQKPREYAEYYNYCEDCKREARAELNK